MRKLDRLIEDMTHRLVTCPLNDFHKVQQELFALQRRKTFLLKRKAEKK